MNILVVGAGLAGCTCARLLADHEHHVCLIEAKKEIGGICRDERDEEHNCFYHCFGPHLFHTNDEWVWNFANRFTTMKEYRVQQKTYHHQKYLDFPLNLNSFEEIYHTPGISEMKVKKLMGLKKRDTPPKNFEEAVIAEVGEDIYKQFFYEYTKKQWQRDCNTLPISFYKRIPVRFNRDPYLFSDQYQGLPDLGYTRMMEKMVSHKNIELYTEVSFEQFKDVDKYDLVIYTGGFSDLPYRSTLFIDAIERKSDYPLVNLPGHLCFTRKTDYTLMHPINADKKCYSHHVCYELPQADNKYNQLLPIPTEENLKKYDTVSKEFLRAHKNTLLIGRLATYQYLNMDQVIAQCSTLLHPYCE